MIRLKSPAEVETMRRSAGMVARTLDYLGERIQPGISTQELDQLAREFIRGNGGVPSFLGYRGYRFTICASINEEVVHGLPGKRRLKDGDIISVDVGVYLEGFHGDAARTFPVGTIGPEAERLLRVTRESLELGVARAVAGGRLGDISAAVQQHVEGNPVDRAEPGGSRHRPGPARGSADSELRASGRGGDPPARDGLRHRADGECRRLGGGNPG